MKYRIEFHLNQDIISIHSTLPFSKRNTIFNPEFDKAKPPKPVGDILDIPGVINCTYINKYELNIAKGSAFDWDEIIEKAVDVIGLLLSPDVAMERGEDMHYYLDGDGRQIYLKGGEIAPEIIPRKLPFGFGMFDDF